MKTGILFDLDGTLLDTLGDLQVAVNHALSQFGYPGREKWEIRSFLGNGMRNLVKRSLPDGVSEERVDEALAIYRAYYESHNQILTAPYEGIYAALEKLKDYPIGVVSNKQDTAVKPMCHHFFGGLYALGEVPDLPRKPDPTVPRMIMDTLGFAPQSTVFVGDSDVDMITAHNAGMMAVGCAWGYRGEADLLSAGADLLLRQGSELSSL